MHLLEAKGVNGRDGAILNVGVPVSSAFKANWILRNKASNLRVIPAGTVVEDACIHVALPTGVAISSSSVTRAVSK